MGETVGKLSVFFDEPFWVGVFERIEDGKLSVAKVTFGAEPKDYEVYDFVLKHYYNLQFSPAVEVAVAEKHINPKRIQREIKKQMSNTGIRVFPRTLSNTQTSLVLKTPKTKTSVRKIFLPSTVAQMLLERKKQIDEMKELFGDEYLDYNLVFCHSSGRPMEGQVINRALKKLIQDNNLPDVVFHSFRHASITYKLKWNGGDMKSVQGDSGHARMDMVADVYSHIIDEDRRYNAQKFEEQFYNAKGLKNAEEGKTAPMPKFETSVELLDPMAEVQKESEAEEEKHLFNCREIYQPGAGKVNVDLHLLMFIDYFTFMDFDPFDDFVDHFRRELFHTGILPEACKQ